MNKSIFKKNFILNIKILILISLMCLFLFYPYTVMNGSDLQKYIIFQNELSLDIISFFKYLYNNRLDGPLFFITVLIYKILFLFNNFIDWEQLFIFINLLSFFLTYLFTSRILEIKDNFNFIIFTFLFWLNLEYFSWSFYTLTDIIFSLLIVVFLLNFVNKNKKYFLIFFIIIFFRSTGIILILFLTQYLLLISFFKEKMISKNLIFGLLLFNFILLFLSAAGFSHLEFGDNQLQEKINFYKEKLSRGVIIDDRPSTYIFGEDSTIFYFKIMILRYFYFFAPYAQEFSFVHKLYNIFYFGIIYFGVICCLINFEKFQIREKLIIIKMILFITSFAVFHSIYIIDYDWRYRMPVYVPMLILSFYSYKLFFDRYIKKLNLKLNF